MKQIWRETLCKISRIFFEFWNLILEVLFLSYRSYLICNTFYLWKRNTPGNFHCTLDEELHRTGAIVDWRAWLRLFFWVPMIITGLIETSARSHANKAARSLTSISAWKHRFTQRSGELGQGQTVHSLVWEADKEALVLKSEEAPSLQLQLPGLTDCQPQPSLSWPQLPCVAQSTSTQSLEKTFRSALVSNSPSHE